MYGSCAWGTSFQTNTKDRDNKLELNRDFESFIESVYRRDANTFPSYANFILRDDELARDAVQEAFRIACCKPYEVMASKNPTGWLINTLKNVIRNVRKSQRILERRFTTYYFEEMDQDAQIDGNVDLMYSDLISEEEFRLLKMIVFEKYSVSEAAEELGIGVEACKKRIQRAKMKLRKRLEED